jgi:MoaA/NifB/PqqE/SkfB family radical SAM enzyme
MQVNNTKQVKAFCSHPFNKAKVSSNGDLNMCCHQSTESRLGNLFEKTFEDLWFSKFAEEIRDENRQGRLHRVCDTSECPFKYKQIADEMTSFTSDARGYPREIEFDLHGSHCNFGGLNPTPETTCIMCPRSRSDFSDYLKANPDRTDEIIEKIKHITPSLAMINILGIAEPFWKDKIFDVLEKMNFEEHKKHIVLWTTSNGSIFNEQRQQKLLNLTNNTDIHFSLDAATSATFMKIRQNDFFELACKNIKSWCEKRDECRKNKTGEHVVRLHNNINMLNVHEVPQMVEVAKDLGVDLLVLLPTHDCGGTHSDLKDILVNSSNYRKFLKAEEKAHKIAKQLGQNIVFSRPLSLGFEKEPQLVQLKLM